MRRMSRITLASGSVSPSAASDSTRSSDSTVRDKPVRRPVRLDGLDGATARRRSRVARGGSTRRRARRRASSALRYPAAPAALPRPSRAHRATDAMITKRARRWRPMASTKLSSTSATAVRPGRGVRRPGAARRGSLTAPRRAAPPSFVAPIPHRRQLTSPTPNCQLPLQFPISRRRDNMAENAASGVGSNSRKASHCPLSGSPTQLDQPFERSLRPWRTLRRRPLEGRARGDQARARPRRGRRRAARALALRPPRRAAAPRTCRRAR